MPDIKTSQIPRLFLEKIADDARTVRYLEEMGQDISGTLPDLINSAQNAADQGLAVANSAQNQAIEALEAALENVNNAINQINSQIVEIVKNIPEDNQGLVSDLISNVANLQALGGSMVPKRKLDLNINMNGVFNNTYTISPACNVNTTFLYYGGSFITGATNADASGAIELTNSTTITARRGTSTGQTIVYFQLVEY